MKIAHLYCYGLIGDSAQSFNPDKVRTFLAGLSEDVTDIEVHINTYGGSLYAAINIHEQLVNSGKRITTIVEGVCASAGTVIQLAGEKRIITENSKEMFHAPMISFEDGEMLNATQLQQLQSELNKDQEEMAAFYMKKTGLDKKAVDEILSKDTWVNADEAIALNFATEKTVELKAVAFVKKQDTPTDKTETIMSNIKDKIVAALESVLGKIKNETEAPAQTESTPTPVATAVALQDGGNIYFEGDAIAVGTKVFTDEAMTMPCPDGTMTLAEGSSITVASGTVTAVVESDAPSDTLMIDALKKELDEVKAELQAAKEAAVSAEAKVKEVENRAVEAVTETVKMFKSEFKPVTSGSQFKADRKESLSDFEKRIEEAKKK